MNISLPEIHIDLVKPHRPAAFLISLILIAFVAALDYLTGTEVSLLAELAVVGDAGQVIGLGEHSFVCQGAFEFL